MADKVDGMRGSHREIDAQTFYPGTPTAVKLRGVICVG